MADETAAPDTAVASSTRTRDPWIKSVRAHGSRRGPLRTELSVRDFVFTSDEPEKIGGTDTAPTPMEIVAGAANACIAVTVESIADELDIAVAGIETQTVAHMDTRGFKGTADVSPHYHDYRLELTVTSDASQHATDELVRRTVKRCPAYNLLVDAGIDVELVWNFVASDGPDAQGGGR